MDLDLSSPEFSCYWWDRDGGQHEELHFLPFHKCLLAAKRLATGPASILEIVSRVIITDGGDSIVFEWKQGLGITWPKRNTDEKQEEEA